MAIPDDKFDTGPARFYQGVLLAGTFTATGTALTGVLTTLPAAGSRLFDPLSGDYRRLATRTSDTAGVLDVAFTVNLSAGSKLWHMQDVGDTKGGVTIEWGTEKFSRETDRRGKVGETISDKSAKVTVPLAEWSPENIYRAMPESLALVQSGGKTLMRGSKSIGLDLSTLGTPAMIVPEINSVETTDPNRIVVFFNLCPSAETVSIAFNRTEQRPINATFMAWDRGDGEIYYIGDNSIRP
jgi:hypothetical protein